MDVELLAVNRVTDAIARCPKLKAHLSSNDKTPFTDGHIDIYTRAVDYSKDDFHGRVPVQVKGRTGLPRQGSKASFPMYRSDLRGHLRDRGVLYFVVYIDPASDRREPYYAVLSPFKIDALLRAAPVKKRTIAVRLKPLPSSPSEIEALLAFAYQTRSEDLEMKAGEAFLGNAREITIHTASRLATDKPVTLEHAEQDFSVVITTADGTTLPADGIFMFAPAEYIGVRTEYVLRAGGFEFRNPTRRRVDEETVELEISAGLRVRLKKPESEGVGSVSIELQDNLAARFSDITFFLGCIDERGFDLDGRPVRFARMDPQDCDDLREHYLYLTGLVELFRKLSVDVALINLTEVTEPQSQQLSIIQAALLGGKEVDLDFHGPMRVSHTVGPWRVELLWVPGVEPGKWKCVDLFGAESRHQFATTVESKSGELEHIRVTPHEIVDETVLPFTLNLHLDEIVGAFDAISGYEETFGRATLFVLRLIAAADSLLARRAEFLTAAEDLNEWIAARSPEEPPHLINRWQITARKREFSAEEHRAIRDLKRSASRGEIEQAALVEIACAILLRDAGEVEHCVAHLRGQEAEMLRGWPIWTLHERGPETLMLAVDDETSDERRQADTVREFFRRSTD